MGKTGRRELGNHVIHAYHQMMPAPAGCTRDDCCLVQGPGEYTIYALTNLKTVSYLLYVLENETSLVRM